MAEAFLNNLAPGNFEAFSAGIEPGVLNPLTVVVMEEVGISMSGHYAKGVDTYLAKKTIRLLDHCLRSS
jgi:arsenate reductase